MSDNFDLLGIILKNIYVNNIETKYAVVLINIWKITILNDTLSNLSWIKEMQNHFI